MHSFKIRVLGSVVASDGHGAIAELSESTQALVAMLVAFGPDGARREQIADELWLDRLPPSWNSAVRNRIAQMRQRMGAESVITAGGMHRLGPGAHVDVWRLFAIAKRGSASDHLDALHLLEGDPFCGIEPSPVLRAFADRVEAARLTIVSAIAEQQLQLDAYSLDQLCAYLQQRPLEPSLLFAVVQAHRCAGKHGRAAEILELGKQRALEAGLGFEEPPVISEPVANVADRNGHSKKQARREAFNAAARDQDWAVAFDVALSGLPAADQIEGDRDRVDLLSQIPFEALDERRRFQLASTMVRQLMYLGREAEALDWSHTSRLLAKTADQQLLVFINGALAGDAEDPLQPLELPADFEEATDESIKMRSLQIALLSHMERSSASTSNALNARLQLLVEASSDPFRRWHAMVLQATLAQLAGELDKAEAWSVQAEQFGRLYDMADAVTARLGQRFLLPWAVGDSTQLQALAPQMLLAGSSNVGRAMQALTADPATSRNLVSDFLQSFDMSSRSIYTVPILVLLASHISPGDSATRHAAGQVLEARKGSSAIVGNGAMHLGPVDRALSQLAVDPTYKHEYLASAVATADRQEVPFWQLVCRLDQAALGADQHLEDQALKLATTDQLQQVALSYSSPFNTQWGIDTALQTALDLRGQ